MLLLLLLLFWFYCYFLLLAYFIVLFGPKVKWNHFQSVALFSALCLIVHDFVNSSPATWIVADHCISSPCMLFFSLSLDPWINLVCEWCAMDNKMRVWISIWYTTMSAHWIFNCVTLLREAALFLFSRLSISFGWCVCVRALLNILFFDNCFKHCSVRSVIFFLSSSLLSSFGYKTRS